MLEVFLIIVFGLFCLCVGFLLAMKWVERQFLDDPKGLIDALKKETMDTSNTDKQLINVVSEIHGDTVFLYKEDTGEYIAKGIDISDAITNACIRFENYEFNVKY